MKKKTIKTIIILTLTTLLFGCSQSYNLSNTKWVVEAKGKSIDQKYYYYTIRIELNTGGTDHITLLRETDEWQLGDELSIVKKELGEK